MQDIHPFSQEELELLKESAKPRVAPVDGSRNQVECNQVEVVGYLQYEHRVLYTSQVVVWDIHQEYEPITVNTLRFFW